jgi:colanic acid/amylovoran biosynthesis glycosyltransferase
MNVTFCAYDKANYVGGPNIWLRRLLPDLRRRGVQSRVLFITVDDPAHCPNLQALIAEGFEVQVITGVRYTEDRVLRILEKVSENPPDVFIPNLMVPAFYASRWVRQAGIPTIGILHSDDDFHLGVQREFVFGPMNYRLSAIVCVSRFIESHVRAQKPVGVEVARLPYGVPVPSRVTSYPEQKPLRLIYSGRLSEKQKQISQVSRSLCRAVKDIQNTEAVIYGDGSARSAVEEILRTDGTGLPIRFAGAVDSAELQRQLLDAHALVLLSDYEGLSIALMEAMACGVVPICLRMRSGVPELVEHRATGLLVDDRESNFVSAVAELRNNPGLWTRLSEGARAKIESEYSSDVCSESWVKFFEQIADRNHGRKKIEVPKALVLPPVSPQLAREDRRREPVYAQLLNKVTDKSRWIAGRIKDRLVGV